VTPESFPEANCTFAKDQPEYLPLPAHRDEAGVVTTCWRLSLRERLRVLVRGRIWWQQMTFGNPLQPQRPDTRSPLARKGGSDAG